MLELHPITIARAYLLKSVPGPALDSIQLTDFLRLRDAVRPILAGTADPATSRAADLALAAALPGAPDQRAGEPAAAAGRTTSSTRK